MVRRILKRLLGIFSSALVGYIFGWILGWSSFDPNSDVWALTALAGTFLGLIVGVGLGARFWRWAGVFFGAALGLFLSWLVRTLVVGDIPNGLGLLVVISGAIAGGVVGARPAFREEGSPLGALTGALLIGFFGGLLVELIGRSLDPNIQAASGILERAPGIILSGVIGGMAGARLGSKGPPSESIG